LLQAGSNFVKRQACHIVTAGNSGELAAISAGARSLLLPGEENERPPAERWRRSPAG
jgi:hypothetical protein